MTVSYRKKVKTRKSVFGLWHQTRAATYSNKFSAFPDSPISDTSPASEPIITAEPSKDRLRIRLTRSGSKLLLLLGRLGSSANSNKTSAESGSCEDPQVSEQRSPPLHTAERDPVYININYSPECASPITHSVHVEPQIVSRRSCSTVLPSPASERAELQEVVQQNDDGDDNGYIVTSDQQSIPSPRLVNRLSQKISTTFGNPTVIQRTHCRSRPAIPFPESPIYPELHSKQGDGANDSSSPSTAPSSNGFQLGHSTPLTPATSAEPPPPKGHPEVPVSDLAPMSDSVSNSVALQTTPGTRPHTVVPSIATVEAASVAKVFLELYFNSIYQNSDPRSQRQHELERRMYTFRLAPDEQFAARCNWLLQENEYLRQCRVLKTGIRSTPGENAISAAGYDAIKVLGKGSFGVVRLVREKRSKKLIRQEDFSIQDGGPNARGHPLDVLKSAVDGTKHGRRRYIAGEAKDVYAMKVIKKSDMIRNSQEGHIRAERDFLVASERSRWVVPLIASFQDKNHLYLVMDYMVGGDFLGLLIRKDVLREDLTRFYIAEMIMCIEEAHRLFWIHRDVKPDNFLVSASGHLKISDFGLAFNGHWSHDQSYYHSHRYSLLEKLGIAVVGDAEDQKIATEHRGNAKIASDPQSLLDYYNYRVPTTDVLGWRDRKERRRFAKSVVGTSQYMAPEVIRGEMYDGRCDWWSLGIILYECLFGFTPFACENRHDTKIKILQHSKTLQFPREKPSDKMVSQEAINLISRILQERHHRLCSREYQANDMLAGRPVTAQFLYSMDPRYRSITSYFVYPNDAADIKAHPFFRGIRWNELHVMQPPLVPKVKNWEDTRYFDDWKNIANIDDGSHKSDSEDPDEDHDEKPSSVAEPPRSRTGSVPEEPVPEEVAAAEAEMIAKKAQDAERRREKKRPRDKILRDKQIGKAALEIRKKGAFLGYTYRRPKGPCMALNADRGRQTFVRGNLGELYGL
ncbi:hypothetical protein N7466_007477 [Penicillium verhagenii]|uniref:uncharacterized protein n=1 Tax=Penicillium verhagenii TaxID=1562060 RepID=UPI0025455C0F|nr:uncharacterized protein N7466_007477 [Penicillium verhagenii]KAJ5928521.1 hypothetical protein N7466_007477 [Penicillium verhagenii]